MSSSWNNIFSFQNIENYSRAAAELSLMLRVLFKEGYSSIILPSRGVLPIFKIAESYWCGENLRLKTFEQRISGRLDFTCSPIVSPITIPFSADISSSEQTTKSIRLFWSNVLAALVNRDSKNKYLLFYKFIVEIIAKKKWESVLPRDLPNKKFIFIDTVVSGRAVCEIIESFEHNGLNECYYIFILDENGEKVKGEYMRTIQYYKSIDRCCFIEIPELFTEDRGPAVSGVWSTVYPEIMERLKEDYSWAGNAYGAGSFYYKVSSMRGINRFLSAQSDYNLPMTKLYGSLSTAYHASITNMFDVDSMANIGDVVGVQVASEKIKEIINQKNEKNRELINFILTNAIKDITNGCDLSPMDQETTKKLAQPRIKEVWKDFDLSVSSSHLLRVSFGQDKINELFGIFDSVYLNKGDAFTGHDDWFRNINVRV